MVEQFIGTWKMISSENFEELLKELGVGAAKRQVANQTRPYFTLSVDDQGMICMKSLNIFKAPELKFKLNEPFVETMLNDEKMRTVVTLENGKLTQKLLEGDGKFIVEREISDGQMIVRSIMGNVVAVRTFEKEE